MSEPQLAIAKSFAQLTDTLVEDFDLVEFLHSVTVHAQRALGVEAVGLLLADNHGGLNVVAASSERARVLELFQLQHAEGPCLDCYRTGWPVSCPDLSVEAGRWPRFVPEALDGGFAAVHALPMRLRERTKGVLAERAGTTVDEAFGLLRDYAHRRDRKLTDVAAAVVRRDPAVADVVVR